MKHRRGDFLPTATVEWATPQDVFDKLDREFHFTLDAAATAENAKCARFYTKEEDGLHTCSWAGEVVWCNPPYGLGIGDWVHKGLTSSRYEGATVVMCLPVRTDTGWWHRFAMKGEIRFLRGRLIFGEYKRAAPFASAIVIFRPPALEGVLDTHERPEPDAIRIGPDEETPL